MFKYSCSSSTVKDIELELNIIIDDIDEEESSD